MSSCHVVEFSAFRQVDTIFSWMNDPRQTKNTLTTVIIISLMKVSWSNMVVSGVATLACVVLLIFLQWKKL